MVKPIESFTASSTLSGRRATSQVSEGVLILKPFKPKIVDVDPSLVEKILSEEDELERRRIKRIAEETFSRH